VIEPLSDGWGREIRSLRVSVTDRCNFRCRYCMPAEGLEWLAKPELLTFEELHRLVAVMARMGVREIRLTGGEPLVRRDLPDLVRRLAHVAGVEDLSLTTNGVLLDRLAVPLADAGLRRLNVSLDSLSHTRFAEITRRDALDRVLAGLAAAEREPRLRPIKVNCVAIRGFSERPRFRRSPSWPTSVRSSCASSSSCRWTPTSAGTPTRSSAARRSV
jgi:GTP 3',8-cyclase